MVEENKEVSVDTSIDTSVENASPDPEADAEIQGSEADSTPAVVADEERANPFQKRIKELTDKVKSGQKASDAQLFEIRQENQRLREELETRPLTEEPLKTLEDFDHDEDKFNQYRDQRTATIAEKAAGVAVGKVEGQIKSASIAEKFEAKEKAFETEVSDYSDVVYGTDGKVNWAASDVMADEIRLSELGPNLAYYLAKNPAEALEISTLSDRETVRRMTLLESTIKSEKAKAGKSVSEAPPPPPEIPSGDKGLDKDPADMSDKEFAAMRRKQIANR